MFASARCVSHGTVLSCLPVFCPQSEVGWFKVGSIIVALLYVVFFALGPGK